MVDFQELMHLRLGKLKSAVPQWESMARKLKQLANGGDEGGSAADLERKAKAAQWKGSNATVTRQFVTKTAQEFDDIAVAAASVHDILENAHASLERHKGDLDAAVARAKNKGLHVSARGFVSAREDADPKPSQRDIDDAVADMDRVLGEANETDRIAKDALNSLSKNKYDFVSKGTTLAAARKLDERQAVADAEEAQNILRQDGPISSTQLAKLDGIFARQSDNLTFATRFFKGLGPEETLRFNVELATQFTLDRDPQNLKRAESLQDSMGRALAAATKDVDAKGYLSDQWVNALKDAGQERIYVEVGGDMGVSAYGYQSLGSLLESGEYSPEFLNSVSQEMIDLDKTLAGVWPDGGSFGDWTLDITDAVDGQVREGLDPISGLMQAQSRTPEAALELFGNKENIDYLLTSDFASDERNEAIGEALESAVYGYPFDSDPPVALPHSQDQAEVMKGVMDLVSRDADLATGHLGDNLGMMTAAYMPEINRSLVEGDELRGLFPSGNSVEIDDRVTQRFLYALARDPEAYADVVYGQNAYSAHMMEHHLSNPSSAFTDKASIQAIAQNSGLMQGVMAHSRADAVIGGAAAEASEYNSALSREGNAFKTMASFGVTVATTAYATGPYAIPIAGAGAAISGGASMMIDEIMGARKMEGSAINEAFFRAGDDYEQTKVDTVHALDRAAWHAADKHTELKEGDVELIVGTAVNNGFSWADTSLDTYQNRPDRSVR